MSTKHQEQLKEFLKMIEDWVYNPTSEQRLQLDIPSNSLKKALSKEINKIYLSTGVFFEHVRGQP